MLKRVISIVCIFVILAGMLAGCSPAAEEAAKPGEAQTASSEEKKFKTDEITIYIRMMEAQDKWFRENIIQPFEKKYGVKVNVMTFQTEMELENALNLDNNKNTIGLVKTMHTQLTPLVEKNLVMTLEEAVGERYKEDIKEYSDAAMEMATVNGKVYYIPRKLETNTLLYLKSKVEDAVNNWTKFESQISNMFKAENGVGLPEGYALEADPNEWDWYDLAVVGYYWANTEYDGKKEPRIAHRGKKYDGTVVELVTKIYQIGGKAEDVLAMDTQPVVDTFMWEAFYRKNNLYNPGMWEEEWSGGGIWNAMAAGKVYMAFMHQMDGFFVHGGSDPSMTGYLAEPDDMAMAIMPQGASLELKDGKPARMGIHGSQLAGWWWGIPKSSPDAELSYELARFITNKENQTRECQTFGIMPIRNDITEDLGNTFKEQWMQQVFDAAQRQISTSVQPLPKVKTFPEIGNVYLEAWYDIVVGNNNKNIQKDLTEKYVPKVAELLK